MARPVMEFQYQNTKLERFLHKNQHTQRKLLNFENWTSNVEPQWIAKIRVFKVDYRISSYSCRGNYSFLNSSSEETIQVFISLM